MLDTVRDAAIRIISGALRSCQVKSNLYESYQHLQPTYQVIQTTLTLTLSQNKINEN